MKKTFLMLGLLGVVLGVGIGAVSAHASSSFHTHTDHSRYNRYSTNNHYPNYGLSWTQKYGRPYIRTYSQPRYAVPRRTVVKPMQLACETKTAYITSDRSGYVGGAQNINAQIGEMIRFYPDVNRSADFMNGSVEWHYDSRNLDCEETENGSLTCTVKGLYESDVWAGFRSNTGNDYCANKVVSSNKIYINQGVGMGYTTPYYANSYNAWGGVVNFFHY